MWCARPRRRGLRAGRGLRSHRHCLPERIGSLFLLVFAHQTLEESRYLGLTADHLERVGEHLVAQRDTLERLDVTPEQEQARDELLWVAEALLTARQLGQERLQVGRDRALQALPEGLRHHLADRIAALGERRRELWLERNREGGLDDALRYLERPRDWLRDVRGSCTVI